MAEIIVVKLKFAGCFFDSKSELTQLRGRNWQKNTRMFLLSPLLTIFPLLSDSCCERFQRQRVSLRRSGDTRVSQLHPQLHESP